MPNTRVKTSRPAPVEGERSSHGTPSRYKVLMHNDDYTTMEFVVEMLEKIFHKPASEAHHIMLHIHMLGKGVCGVYPYEIAETKASAVHRAARAAGYPLRCSLEAV